MENHDRKCVAEIRSGVPLIIIAPTEDQGKQSHALHRPRQVKLPIQIGRELFPGWLGSRLVAPCTRNGGTEDGVPGGTETIVGVPFLACVNVEPETSA